eukprot:11277132-Alexandrium_andersonii.AAC.1
MSRKLRVAAGGCPELARHRRGSVARASSTSSPSDHSVEPAVAAARPGVSMQSGTDKLPRR